MINSAVVIPCLNPDDRMVDYAQALSDEGFAKIIVVNDGSSEEYDSFFQRAEAISNCVVLKHVENRGKGCALKTAMKYYLDSCTGCNGIITADAELKTSKNGNQYTGFRVMVTETYGDEKRTTFYDVAFSRNGLVNYLKKNRQVYVSGRLSLSAVCRDEKAYLNAYITDNDGEL